MKLHRAPYGQFVPFLYVWSSLNENLILKVDQYISGQLRKININGQ